MSTKDEHKDEDNDDDKHTGRTSAGLSVVSIYGYQLRTNSSRVRTATALEEEAEEVMRVQRRLTSYSCH